MTTLCSVFLIEKVHMDQETFGHMYSLPQFYFACFDSHAFIANSLQLSAFSLEVVVADTHFWTIEFILISTQWGWVGIQHSGAGVSTVLQQEIPGFKSRVTRPLPDDAGIGSLY